MRTQLPALAIRCSLFACCLMPPTLCGAGQAQSKDDRAAEHYPVRLEVRAGKADAAGRQAIDVTLTIDPEWEVFANPVLLPELEACQTVLRVTSAQPPRSI